MGEWPRALSTACRHFAPKDLDAWQRAGNTLSSILVPALAAAAGLALAAI